MATVKKLIAVPTPPPPQYALELTEDELHFLKAAVLLQTQGKKNAPAQLQTIVREIESTLSLYIAADSPAYDWFRDKGGR